MSHREIAEKVGVAYGIRAGREAVRSRPRGVAVLVAQRL
jgi:hypothetical protein